MAPPSAAIRPVRRIAILAFLVLASLSAAFAAPADDHSFDAQALALRSIGTSLARPDAGDKLDDLRVKAAHLATATEAAVVRRQAELGQIDARAKLLGPAPPGIVEAADIQAQRRDLAEQHADLDSTIKRGKLIAISADQLVTQIDAIQARAISDAMTRRLASPVLPVFWSPVVENLPHDLGRLRTFMAVQADATVRGLRAGGLWLALAGLLAAAALIGPARHALLEAGQRVMVDHAPASRLRRSGLALWLGLVGTMLPWFSVLILVESFRVAGMLSAPWDPLATIMLRAVLMASLITSVGGALLQRRRPSWRLLPIGDETAATLRPWTFVAAATAFVSIGITALIMSAGASAPGRGAGALLVTIMHLVLVIAILLAVGRIRIAAAAASIDEVQDDKSLAGVALVTMMSWAIAVGAVVALLLGYVTLGLTMSMLLLWLPTVAAALYLLLVSVDDLCTELICGTSAFGGILHDAFGLRRSLVTQTGVALSAALRVALILFAAGVAFVPFGSNFGQLVAESIEISHGITVGKVTISPGAILRAVLVLAGSLFVVRVIGRWLTERYLPATELDTGARNSISTVTSYIGIILATLWALAALGIGFERIALILSALSVGIGFGLQAITQNFVSGLILLIERPVKIGDLIRVGDQEGDVKRINVRATEIVVGDRSTLIVPNSELITKSVRNMTLADPIGRVQVDFAVPLDVDIGWVRAMVIERFAAADAVLADPAPQVFLDSLEEGSARFRCVGYVSSPRLSYAARSEILFEIVAALRAAGIDLSGSMSTRPAARATRSAKEDEDG